MILSRSTHMIFTALIIFSVAASGANAADIAWLSASDGDWTDGTNWEGGTPPSSGDTAIIAVDGTYIVTVDADVTVDALTLGAAAGTQTLSISDTHTLTLDGAGGSTVGANGVIMLDGMLATLQIGAETVLEANSQVIGEGLLIHSSGALSAHGTIDIDGSVANSGGSFMIDGPFTAGSLNLMLGTLTMNTDAIVANVSFSGGTWTGSGEVTISDAMTWTAGTLSGTGDLIIDPLATLTLSDDPTKFLQRDINSSGTTNWTSGQLRFNDAVFTNLAGGVFNATGSLNTDFSSGTNRLVNAGTFNRDGEFMTTFEDGVRMFNNGTVNVLAGTLELLSGGSHAGVFNVSPNATLWFGGTSNTLSGSSQILGDGEVVLATGTWIMAGTVNLGGSISILGGTNSFTGSFSGTTIDCELNSSTLFSGAVSGTTLNVTNSSVTLDSATSWPDIALAGTLGGNGDISVTGALNWTSGTLSGPGQLTIEPGATLAVSGGAAKLLQTDLANDGTTSWTAGQLQFSDAVFTNNGQFDSTGDVDTQSSNGTSEFNNVGTFVRYGPGVTTFTDGVVFTNNGTMQVTEGTLSLDAGLSNFEGATLNGGTYDLSATLRFASADIVTNAASIVLDGPFSEILTPDDADGLANFAANDATGELTITNGRDLNTSGGFSNAGEVTISGADSSVVAGGDYTQTAGSTVIQDGTLGAMSLVDLQGGLLKGRGTVDAHLSNAAVIQLGFSPGQLDVIGDYVQTSTGLLAAEIRGTVPGDEYDVLAVTGDATLDGEIYADVIDGFEPVLGSEFHVLTANAVAGTFAVEDLSLFFGGSCQGVDYRVQSATLVTVAESSILVQPQGQDGCAGDALAFTVTVDDGGPYDYQWRKDGEDLPGETNSSLTIDPVSPADAGGYDVVISNVCGFQSSQLATLTVGIAPAITTQPVGDTVCEGAMVILSVSADGTPPPTFQWRKDGEDLVGETDSSLTLDPAAASDDGVYDVVVTNFCGSETSAAAQVVVNTPPVITVQPVDQVVCAGDFVMISVSISGTPQPALQWRKDGQEIAGETGDTLVFDPVSGGDVGDYDVVATNECGTILSDVAQLTVDQPNPIIEQPVDAFSCDSEPVMFSVVAEGSPSYQWRKDGVHLANETDPVLIIDPVTPEDEGVYDVRVTNVCGLQISDPAELAISEAPFVTANPVVQIVCEGDDAQFTVMATGTPEPTYQWRKNDQDLPGETSSTLIIDPVEVGDSGSYDVVVTNVCGSVISNPAALVVNAAPSIATQPADQQLCEGDALMLSVTASGVPAPAYQWRKDGENLPGATTNTLIIDPAVESDSGIYDVVLTNACGVVVSDPADVQVIAPCPPDLNCDGSVGVEDLLMLIGAWGTMPVGPPDLDGSGEVDVSDLLMLISAWGPC